MKNSKEFSIVTVCYNCKDVIRKTLESVLSQDGSLFEYIVIDGGSCDGTTDIIEEYKERLAVFISEKDDGIYDAMNKGINYANGKFLCFINAGDFFIDRTILYKVTNAIDNDTDVAFGNIVCEKYGELYEYISEPFYDHLPLHQSMGFTHQSTFVRTVVAKKYPFDTSFKLAADYNQIITIWRNGAAKFQNLNFPIAYYDLGGASALGHKQHHFETLTIDRPNNPIKNILENEYAQIRYIIKNTIKGIVGFLCPDKFHSNLNNNPRFKKYDRIII